MDTEKEKCLEEIWKDDKLGRKADAEFLITFLTNSIECREKDGREKSYVLNIDAAWGGGKSFFLEHLGRHLEVEGYLVASVNAWEDDHAADPLIAVMAAVDVMLEKYLSKNDVNQEARRKIMENTATLFWAFGKEAVRQGLKKVAGDITAEIFQAMADVSTEEATDFGDKLAIVAEAAHKHSSKSENNPPKVFEEFLAGKKLINRFRGGLKDLIDGVDVGSTLPKFSDNRKAPLFVLVDEMDRCRPPYAIALLERVKHLFNIDNMIFVFATDTSQLSHSIKAVYGERFDGHRYLRRFFDRTFRFSEPSVGDFVDALKAMRVVSHARVFVPGSLSVRDFCVNLFQDLNMSLRDIEQCLDIFRTIVEMWNSQHPQVHAIVMLPLIIAFHNGLELQWNESMTERVHQLLMKNLSAKMDFKLELPDEPTMAETRIEFSDPTVAIGWWEVFESYIKMGQKSETVLTDFLNEDKRPEWQRRIGRRLLSEYSGNKFDAPFHPSMRQYFNAISSAGRLGSL